MAASGGRCSKQVNDKKCNQLKIVEAGGGPVSAVVFCPLKRLSRSFSSLTWTMERNGCGEQVGVDAHVAAILSALIEGLICSRIGVSQGLATERTSRAAV